MRTPPDGSRRPLPPEDLPPTPPGRVSRTVDKGHGRLEVRTLRTTSILTVHEKWAGLAQGFEITRERTIRGKTTVETVHGITSLSEGRADAATLSKHLRDHWKIETERHYVRDVTLKEDACRVRRGHAAQFLAAVRNALLHVLSKVGAKSRPEALERLQTNPAQAMELLGIAQNE